MLTYTLSKREKALILLLVVVLVVIAWFMLVFQRTNDELVVIEGEIANVQSEMAVNEARIAQIESMKAVIAEHEKAGEKPLEVPDYDNMKPLMVELNNVLAAADTYAISFDDISVDSASGYVERGVKIEFGCESYDAAKVIVSALADGKFPCVIDSVSISDNTVGGLSRSSGSNVSVSLKMTYLEKR